MARHGFKLIVLDIDNTLFDWVSYYTLSFQSLIEEVAEVTGIEARVLRDDARQVFTQRASIEYPFVIQSMASVRHHYGEAIDQMLAQAVAKGRQAFLRKADQVLVPYEGVLATLARLRQDHAEIPIAALTDAPRYVAMWKLNKLGVLPFFDSVYGLGDPELPVCLEKNRILVDEDILVKHHLRENFGFKGKIRILPEDYEKPGTKGLRTVLMDYLDDLGPQDLAKVLWVGDNLRKDVALGRQLGVYTAWAQYGTHIDPHLKERLLEFSPPANIHKNVALDPGHKESPKPHLVMQSFSDLLALF